MHPWKFQQPKKETTPSDLQVFFLQSDTENIVPFNLLQIASISVSSDQARSSLDCILSALESFNRSFATVLHYQQACNTSIKASCLVRRVTRSYQYLKKIHNEMQFLHMMDTVSKDLVVNNICLLMLEKEGRRRVVQNNLFKNTVEETDEICSINASKKSIAKNNLSRTVTRWVDFANAVPIVSTTQDKKRAQRKLRLYRPSIGTSNRSLNPANTVWSAPNKKLLWSWTIKEKCKQFATSNVREFTKNKTIDRGNKLLQHSYLSKKQLGGMNESIKYLSQSNIRKANKGGLLNR